MQTDQGYYMYIETSLPQQPNDTARLVGQPIATSSSAVCLTFYTHMYGDHVGTLNLYTKPTGMPIAITTSPVHIGYDELVYCTKHNDIVENCRTSLHISYIFHLARLILQLQYLLSTRLCVCLSCLLQHIRGTCK